jgi:hypothetical protein
VGAKVPRHDIMDMGRIHAMVGNALVFHGDQDSSDKNQGMQCSSSSAGARGLLVTPQDRARLISLLLLRSLRFNHYGLCRDCTLFLTYNL